MAPTNITADELEPSCSAEAAHVSSDSTCFCENSNANDNHAAVSRERGTAADDAAIMHAVTMVQPNGGKRLFVELFAGTARLSRAAMEAGFEIMPVDHSSARAEHVSIVPTDMAVPEEVDALIDVLSRRLGDIAFVWAAPPCGTASKARERPIPDCSNAPQPLRSQDCPDGLHGLGGIDKAKTELANQSYEGLCRVLSFLHASQIPFTVENPVSSYMWLTTPFAQIKHLMPHDVVFDSCMHGGQRAKATLLRGNSELLSSLGIRCSRDHPHKSWKPTVQGNRATFPTKEEAAYPLVLCRRVVECLGCVKPEPATMAEAMQQSDTAVSRLVLGALPRGKKAKPLVQ